MSQPWTPGGSGIWCDLYELTMAVGYLEHGVTGEAVFSLYVRDLPPDRGYLVVGGVDDAVDAVCDLGFSHEDLAWLRGIGLTSAATNRLAGLRFTGEVRAVPEGRVVTAGEPIIEVRAPIAEAQLAETLVLNQLTYQTTIATKLARCVHAAQDRIELVDFAFRRAHGIEAALSVARLAGIVGFTGTSNVPAARLYGMRPVGTMAHSFVEAFPTERDAFRAYAATFPERTTFLVDTYDTLEGVDRAVDVIKEAGLVHNVAVRLDSGDLGGLARAARARLDEAGLHRVRIFASGGIDEHVLARLVAAGAPVDSAGVGTKVGVAADAPYLDTVYKLVSYEGRPVRKLSTGKASMPGAKQVWRPVPLLADAAAAARAASEPHAAAGESGQSGQSGEATKATEARRDRRHRPGDGPEPGIDIVTERDELVDGAEPLLVPVVTRGRRVVERSTPAAARRRFQADLAALPAPALDLRHPRPLTARFSDALLRLADEADRSHAAAEARRAPG